jgi:hypothetical protein
MTIRARDQSIDDDAGQHAAAMADVRHAASRSIMSRAPADPREALRQAVAGGRDGLAALSRMLGHADGYLHRFTHSGVPIALCAEDHRHLADFVGVTERALGICDLLCDRH